MHVLLHCLFVLQKIQNHYWPQCLPDKLFNIFGSLYDESVTVIHDYFKNICFDSRNQPRTNYIVARIHCDTGSQQGFSAASPALGMDE